MIILGIETSCDETGIAIYDSKCGILFEYTYSQNIHKLYGGTVPELASKDHLKKIIKLILFTLKKIRLTISDINCISYTIGPGLKSSLFIGIVIGKTLSFALNIPAIGVNHLKSHIAIAFLFNRCIKFPVLILFLSGAHTFILEMNNFDRYIILGQTLDDSVGETFDKIARSLKLIPNNGKKIEKYANKNKYFSNLNYPKSYCYSNNFDFSFSGVKSAVIRDISNRDLTVKNKINIAYNFQNTLIKIILDKCVKLICDKKYKIIILSGGVSSNKELRLSLNNYAYLFDVKFCTQPIKYCTDNGAMIAFFGFIKFSDNIFDRNLNIFIKPNLGLG